MKYKVRLHEDQTFFLKTYVDFLSTVDRAKSYLYCCEPLDVRGAKPGMKK